MPTEKEKIDEGQSRALSLLATRLLGLFLGLGGSGFGGAPSLLVRASRGRLLLGSSSGSSHLTLATTGSLLGGLGGGLCLLGLLGCRSSGHGLKLLSNGVLIIGRRFSLGDILELRHGDLEILGVLECLLVRHTLGNRVAILVRVNTGVVETEVVLIGVVPALLLMGSHVSPSSLAFLLDRTLGCLRAQVVRDDRASVLHVQEVRSQGALGRVGVNGSLLAFLLLLNRRSQLRRVNDQLLSSMLKVGKKVILRALGSRLAKQEVGLADIVGSERSEELKNGSQATDGLDEVRRTVLKRVLNMPCTRE
jgi:hypothetical protein